jgi:hypothetical protein
MQAEFQSKLTHRNVLGVSVTESSFIGKLAPRSTTIYSEES